MSVASIERAPASAAGQQTTIALVGRPNSGKSSLYNRVTGGNARVGNYPGITIDVLEAEIELPSRSRAVIADLPGLYSVEATVARDTDEGVARTFIDRLRESATGDAASRFLVVQVIDPTRLALGLRLTRELAKAKLSESFRDVLLGPNKDGDFPETKEGIKVSELSAKQKKLVLAAMRPWVADADDATAKKLMKTYTKELDQTYISYSGGTGLDTQGDYVRIDGPSVWIEFVCQNGVVYQGKVHYHTVYRDHDTDYGGEFSF